MRSSKGGVAVGEGVAVGRRVGVGPWARKGVAVGGSGPVKNQGVAVGGRVARGNAHTQGRNHQVSPRLPTKPPPTNAANSNHHSHRWPDDRREGFPVLRRRGGRGGVGGGVRRGLRGRFDFIFSL